MARIIVPEALCNTASFCNRALTRISHHLTVEARNRPATTVLRLLAVLNVLFKYARIIQEMRRRASRLVRTGLSRTSSRHVARKAG